MNYAGSPSHSPATLWFYTVVFTSVVPRPAASALPGNLCKKYRFLYPTPGCVHAKLLQSCPNLWTIACQAPLSMGFSRQEYWIGLQFPPRRIFLIQGWNPSPYVSCIGRQVPYHFTTWEAPSQTC